MPEGTYYHPAISRNSRTSARIVPSWRRSSSTGTGRSSRMARSRRGRNPLSRWPWPHGPVPLLHRCLQQDCLEKGADLDQMTEASTWRRHPWGATLVHGVQMRGHATKVGM